MADPKMATQTGVPSILGKAIYLNRSNLYVSWCRYKQTNRVTQ